MPNFARYLIGFGQRKPDPSIRILGSHPLSRGLAACWLMNEGGTTVRDSSPTGATGTPSATGITVVPGLFGGPGRHDDRTGYIDIGTKLSIPGECSLLCRFLTELDEATGVHQAILWDNDTSGQIGIRVNSLNTVDWFQGGNGVSFGASSYITKNVWHHIALIRTGSSGSWTLRCYLEGKEIAGSPQTMTNDPAATPTDMRLMASPAFGFNFQGTFDHVAVWTRALSVAEINEAYQQPFCFLRQAAPKRPVAFTQGAPAGPFFPMRSFVIGPGFNYVSIPNWLVNP